MGVVAELYFWGRGFSFSVVSFYHRDKRHVSAWSGQRGPTIVAASRLHTKKRKCADLLDLLALPPA